MFKRLFLSSIFSLSFLFAAVTPAFALGAVSLEVDSQNGFPLSYTDAKGVILSPCLDGADPQCVLPGAGEEPNFDPSKPTEFPGNFPSEYFYYIAESDILTTPTGGKVMMRFAIEGAFLNEDPAPGDQMVFGRIRLTGTGLEPSSTYTVTHPYGVDTYTTDALGAVRRGDGTEDIGCEISPCDFSLSLGSRVLGAFLKAEAGAPAGYLGDAITPHTVIGAPSGNNFVKIEGPGLPALGLQTNLFTVSGKLATGAPAPIPPPPGCTVNTAPVAPTLSTPGNGATGVLTSPTLTWNVLANFGTNCAGNNNQFEVFVDEGNLTPITSQGVFPSTQTSQAITGLTPNTTYSWKVRASNGAITSDSIVFSFTTAPLPPTPPSSAPSSLRASSVAGSVTLSWASNTTNQTEFKIERRISGSPAFSLLATVTGDKTTYIDNTAPKGVSTYRIQACNIAGCSDFSNKAFVFNATTLISTPATPTMLKAKNAAGSVNLTWKDNAANEASYEVERRTPITSTFTKITTLGANAVSFTDPTATRGVNIYRVRACNTDGCSAYSNLGILFKP